MTKDELVEFLNERATKSGDEPVNKRILSDWIDKGLLEPARAYGREIGLNPEWHLDNETVEYAQLLHALRSLGVKRASSLRIYLCMFCQDANAEHFLEALRIEYRRVMQRFRRAHGWFLGAHTHKVRSEKRDRLLAKLSSQLDPALSAAGFKLPSDIMLALSRESIEPSGKPINELCSKARLDSIERES